MVEVWLATRSGKPAVLSKIDTGPINYGKETWVDIRYITEQSSFSSASFASIAFSSSVNNYGHQVSVGPQHVGGTKLTPLLARSFKAFLLLSFSFLARLYGYKNYARANTERGTNAMGSIAGGL
jgi:hypothetical protein